MSGAPFDPSSKHDDLAIALAIEEDAARLEPADVTLARYLAALPDLALRPNALDAALEVAIVARAEVDGSTPLAAARAIGLEHPALADALAACALGLGIEGEAPDELVEGSLVFGRWRIERLLGRGVGASVFLAIDEVLSTPDAPVRVVVKRYDDAAGSAAREHALREVRALALAPAGVAPEAVALAAPIGERAHLVLRHEESRPASSLADVAEAGLLLQRLHRAGLAHGDLKPEHVRLRPNGSAFLVDFGLAAPATPSTRGEDLERLAASALLLAVGRLERLGARAARHFARSRRHRRATLALLLASRRHWWRASRYSAPRAAILSTALGLGIWGGRAFVQPALPAPNPEHLIRALKSTGRLSTFRIGPDGSVDQIGFRLPELDSLRETGMFMAKGVRFNRDGTVEFIEAKTLTDVLPESTSQSEMDGQ